MEKKEELCLEDLSVKEHYLHNLGPISLLKWSEEQGCGIMLNNREISKLLTMSETDDIIIYNLNTDLLLKSIGSHSKYDYLINLILSIYDRFELKNKKEIDILIKYQQMTRKLNRPLTDKELEEHFNIPLDYPKLNELEILKEIRRFLYFTYAYQSLFKHNLRLVISLAQKYKLDDQMDLINEGNLALMKAIDRYEPLKGMKFSTYATWWVKEAIRTSYFDNHDHIRICNYYHSEIPKFIKKVELLEKQEGRPLKKSEIAKKLNMSLQTVNTYYACMLEYLPMDKYVGDGSDSTIGDFIPDRRSVEDIVAQDHLKEDIEVLYRSLTEREMKMVKLSYGIDCDHEHTNYEIADIFNLTQQRVSQILAKAKKAMIELPKYDIKVYELKEYIG